MRGLGGSKVEDAVRTILRRLIHKNLVPKYSYTGQGSDNKAFNSYCRINSALIGKSNLYNYSTKFETFLIKSFIDLDAIRQNRKLSEEDKTESTIKQIVMNFFRFNKKKPQNN